VLSVPFNLNVEFREPVGYIATMQYIGNIPVWNSPDPDSVEQIRRCSDSPDVAASALMADHHKGYSMPIGGVIAYRNKVSPSAVGFDISCGNKAVCTNLLANEVQSDLNRIMDEIFSIISFGVGQTNHERVDHELYDDPAWKDIPHLAKLRSMARDQLGTVGGGNHFVDLLRDEQGRLWVANHFGSRGLGYKIATGFMNLAHGRGFFDRSNRDSMDAMPTILDLTTQIGLDYWAAMQLAGRYAYAGRDWVCDKVLEILGASSIKTIHNHHNFAWKETHLGEELIVIRKGATPAFPGQFGFVGGSMGEDSYIVEGVESDENRIGLFSTVHGAGRVLSRTAAAGRLKKNSHGRTTRSGGQVKAHEMLAWINKRGVVLRGGGLDEAPQCYKRLSDVIRHHQKSIRIIHTLSPIGVAMAGEDVIDPYKD